MPVLVLDASAAFRLLTDDTATGPRLRRRLVGEVALSPELLDVEVLHALRRAVLRHDLTPRRADEAVDDLSALPVRRVPHRPLLARAWQLRDTVTAYDGLYVALAEARGCPLLTEDARLARSPGPSCTFELLEP